MKIWKQPVKLIVLILLLCGSAAFFTFSLFSQKEAQSAVRPVKEDANVPPAPRPAMSNPQATSPVTQAAVQAGVLSCASRINQVVQFLTGNSISGAFLFLPQSQPDQRIFSTSLEILPENESTIYASASFAPYKDSASGAVYDMIQYHDAGCAELQRTGFKDFKKVGPLKKNITMLDSGPVKIFLMPAGTGCVTIKKEVVQ